MTKRKNLSDLYVVGKAVKIEDTDGYEEIWLQKLNPAESELALRRANAERAKVLATQHDPTSEVYQNVRSEVEDYATDKNVLVEYLAGEAVASLTAAGEAELEAEEEWSKDQYLQGLRDAWSGGLVEEYAKDPEHADAKRVFAEMERFSELVDEKIKDDVEASKEDFARKTMEELVSECCVKFLQVQADMAWMAEYRKSEIWLATREAENHKKRYFDNRTDLDDLQSQVFLALVAELSSVQVDVTEGKD